LDKTDFQTSLRDLVQSSHAGAKALLFLRFLRHD
jgi:hypothetical protein